MTRLFTLRSAAISTLALVGACAGGGSLETAEGAATVIGLSTDRVAIGGDIKIIGANFLSGRDGHTEVVFEGDYFADNGNVHPVSLRLRPHWDDGNSMMLSNFGPFSIPFSPTGDELGTFEGRVVPLSVLSDGAELRGEPADVTLEIAPSIIVRTLQPIGASCERPSRIFIGGLHYEVEIEAIGFTPVNFSYYITEPGGMPPRIIRHEASGTRDRIGDSDGGVHFGYVEDVNSQLDYQQSDDPNVGFYIGELAVTARDDQGDTHFNALSFGVHRPIEYITLPSFRVAEIEPARPVSGCYSGGNTNGSTISWTETESETRTRQIGVTWNESWLRQNSINHGATTTTTNGFSYDISTSNREGNDVGYVRGSTTNWEAGGTAGFSVPFLAKAEVSGKGGQTYYDQRTGRTFSERSSTQTVGRDYSVSDTESWSFTQTDGHTLAQGGSDFFTVSTSNTTSRSYTGFVIPGEYGVVYRQVTRIVLPGVIVAFNQCGQSDVVAETKFSDYAWSLDLAQGSECPPFPKSNLPEAECFEQPCSGQ